MVAMESFCLSLSPLRRRLHFYSRRSPFLLLRPFVSLVRFRSLSLTCPQSPPSRRPAVPTVSAQKFISFLQHDLFISSLVGCELASDPHFVSFFHSQLHMTTLAIFSPPPPFLSDTSPPISFCFRLICSPLFHFHLCVCACDGEAVVNEKLC